ncbi:hypothetical protein PRIPAC_91861, partial [Pristionchus pacificus]|uniref:Uncharacterized protein n=1 Tax=Pristionchus pacificus TaxID=54126 RepID=A0A2A6CVA7_PRIPA
QTWPYEVSLPLSSRSPTGSLSMLAPPTITLHEGWVSGQFNKLMTPIPKVVGAYRSPQSVLGPPLDEVGDTRRVAQADGRGFSKLEVEESGVLNSGSSLRIM